MAAPAGSGEVGVAGGPEGPEVTDARPIGGTWLLDGLWRELGGAALAKAVADRRFTTAVERVLLALADECVAAGAEAFEQGVREGEFALESTGSELHELHGVRRLGVTVEKYLLLVELELP